jgi:hypothetical protein
MILKEWGEIRQLYTDCWPGNFKTIRATKSAWTYWCFWVPIGLLILLLLLALVDIFSFYIPAMPALVSVFGFVSVRPWVICCILGLVSLYVLSGILEKVYAKTYQTIYATYGLQHYPQSKRPCYLYYALFLHGLTDRASLTRETLAQLRSFADIAGPPPLPESRLLQPVYVVPFIVLLNAIILEVLKQAELLKDPWWRLILPLLVVGLVTLYCVLRVWSIVTNVEQLKDRQLLRFLQWAEHDIDEARVLRTQRLRAELPGPHGPSR